MTEGKLTLTVGKRGMGKSLYNLCLFSTAMRPSIFVNPRVPIRIPNTYLYTSLDQFKNANVKYPPNAKVQFCFYTLDYTNREKITNDYLELFDHLTGLTDCNIFIDEISLWVNSFKVIEPIHYLVSYTRTQNINLFFIARRPQDFNPLLMSQCDLLCCFQITNLRDIEYLSQSYHVSFDMLKSLQRFEFVLVGDTSPIITR